MGKLFDAPLSEGRPPEDRPQPVASWPGWVWWTGVNGYACARRAATSPPLRATAPTFTGLLAEIRAAETGRNQ